MTSADSARPLREDRLAARYREVRGLTDQLAARLSAEDQVVQSMPDVSPTKWHRAHTTWFFETFLLQPHLAGYSDFDPLYGYLFNSYYEAVGERHPRPERGLVTRPGVAEVAEYRAHVDDAMEKLLSTDIGPETRALVTLGLHHEQQHQELVLMDIKHVLWKHPAHPPYDERPHDPAEEAVEALRWHAFDEGLTEIGLRNLTDDEIRRADPLDFAFDNEYPRHKVWLERFELADRLVTAGEWLQFMADGGYRQAGLWLSDGWYAVQREGWEAPLYWQQVDGEWWVHTLTGFRPVDLAEPVVHVSQYEADAFATWSGARLPTENEWEHACLQHDLAHCAGHGNLLSGDLLHPAPACATGDTGEAPKLRQMFGDVWEWTASPYTAYPGFVTADGAVGEYNGKFMSGQMVLRGGSCVTPGDHIRPTYRNFFPPAARWAFSGVRLAR